MKDKIQRLLTLFKKIFKYLKLLFTNPFYLINIIIGKYYHTDPFYGELIRKKVVKYDKKNKTIYRKIIDNKMHLNPLDNGISKTLALQGIRENESVEMLKKILNPNMTVFDLGANIGFYVLIEAQIISQGLGKIIALEPAPENLRLLKLNVLANKYEKCVNIFEGAICDITGNAKLILSSSSNSHKLAKLKAGEEESIFINVPTYNFNDFLKLCGTNLDEIDLLRMDIEGAEYEILHSIIDKLELKKTFKMFIEFHPDVDKPAHIDLLKKLSECGYQCTSGVKEYVENSKIRRKKIYNPDIKRLYEDDFLMQKGGLEVFLCK